MKRKSCLNLVHCGVAFLVFMFAVSPASAESETFTNSIGMEFVLIPAGSFQMGPHESENSAKDENPCHNVTISQPFFMGKFEVTQEQWMRIMGENPSDFQGPGNPVENVSWNDAQVFIRKLNQAEGANKYRLPTEAEWEYASRGGADKAYCYGNDLNAERLHEYAWYQKNSDKKTHPVGTLKPNAWGVHDMHGNVWEWVQDWYDSKYYSAGPAADPKGPSSGTHRVRRGGGWYDTAGRCRSAERDGYSPDYCYFNQGFRVVSGKGQ